MPKLLNALCNKSIYRRKDDLDGNELWLNFPTTTTESNMAKFLNAILQAVKNIAGQFLTQRFGSFNY